MGNSEDQNGAIADWLTDRALRTLIGTAMLMPHPRRVAFMGGLVKRLGRRVGYETRVFDNLSRIRPDFSQGRRQEIADGVLDNFGRTLIENYSYKTFGSWLEGTAITGEGLASVEEARAAGRPVLFVTGHFGNHEVPRQVLAARGYEIGGLYRPMANRFFNDHYAKTMTELSGPVFPQGKSGTIGFARHLKNGGMGTLLFDVDVPGGMVIDLLGHPARTASSAADLALRFDALVETNFSIRQPDGLNFEAAIEAPIPHSDPRRMMIEMTRRLEARIEANPEQWFWVHRRWKARR